MQTLALSFFNLLNNSLDKASSLQKEGLYSIFHTSVAQLSNAFVSVPFPSKHIQCLCWADLL